MNNRINDNTHSGNSPELSDVTLRSLMRATLHGAPPDPLFTRKVLNRLPERRRAWCVRLEYGVYLAALVFLTIVSVRFVASVIDAGSINIFDVMNMTILGVLGAGVVYSLVAPFVTALARRD